MSHPGELLSAWLDGELRHPELEQLAAHLTACQPCHGVLDDLAQARTAVRGLPLLEMPAGIAPAIEF